MSDDFWLDPEYRARIEREARKEVAAMRAAFYEQLAEEAAQADVWGA